MVSSTEGTQAVVNELISEQGHQRWVECEWLNTLSTHILEAHLGAKHYTKYYEYKNE